MRRFICLAFFIFLSSVFCHESIKVIPFIAQAFRTIVQEFTEYSIDKIDFIIFGSKNGLSEMLLHEVLKNLPQLVSARVIRENLRDFPLHQINSSSIGIFDSPEIF